MSSRRKTGARIYCTGTHRCGYLYRDTGVVIWRGTDRVDFEQGTAGVHGYGEC